MKDSMPFSRTNYLLFLLGVVLLFLGFLGSGIGPYDGFVSLTLSPIVLGIAYLVVLPAAILLRTKGD